MNTQNPIDLLAEMENILNMQEKALTVLRLQHYWAKWVMHYCGRKIAIKVRESRSREDKALQEDA